MPMQEKSVREKRVAYQTALASSLDQIVARLRLLPDVHQVILFGSYASGRRDLFTDLDLLIVMESQADFVTRTVEMYRYLDAFVDLDLLVYTPEELERSRTWGFVRHALEHGRILYAQTTC